MKDGAENGMRYFGEDRLPESTAELEAEIKKQTAVLAEYAQALADDNKRILKLNEIQQRLAYLFVLYGGLTGRREGNEGIATELRADEDDRTARYYRFEFDQTYGTDPDRSPMGIARMFEVKADYLENIAWVEERARTVRARLLEEQKEEERNKEGKE